MLKMGAQSWNLDVAKFQKLKYCCKEFKGLEYECVNLKKLLKIIVVG